MKNTVFDFWRMLCEHKSASVVVLCSMDEGEVSRLLLTAVNNFRVVTNIHFAWLDVPKVGLSLLDSFVEHLMLMA